MATEKQDLLLELGIKLPDLLAGFAGGLVNAIAFKRASPASLIGSVIVGMFTANYLGDSVAQWLRVNSGTAAFLVGIGGMALVQGTVEAMRNWRPFGPGGGSNAPK